MAHDSAPNENTSPKKPAKFDAKSHASGAVDKLFGARQGEQVVAGLKLIRHEHIEIQIQPRTTFSADQVTELASSIAELRAQGEGIEGTGILQPLIVTLLKNPTGARYRLIAGERRFRASQEVGLPQVPCLVLPVAPNSVLSVQLIENLQRQNLAPLEEARSLSLLKDEQNLSVRDIAKSLGKTRGYVTNRLDLLKMGADIQEMVSSREDTLKHAALINTVADATQRRELIQAVIEDGASVKTIEHRISAGTLASNASDSSAQVSSREDTFKPQQTSKTRLPTDFEESDNPHPSDLIVTSLQPAAAFVAEAARQVQELHLTPDYKRRLRDAVRDIQQQLSQIEIAIK